MSLSNITKPNPNVPELVEFSKQKGKLIISADLAEQIKFLCSNISTVEWSGPLYYTSEGEFDNPSSFVCTAKHILLMDKGTSGFTSYDFSSPLFMDGLTDNPQLMDMEMGHVH